MNAALIVGLVLAGLTTGWVLHRRSVHGVQPILRRLAAEKSGTVESPSRFVMPKLLFYHSSANVEVSSASDGDSTRYTYVLFSGLDSRGLEFCIRPRSLQTIGDQWIGLKKPVVTSGGLDKRLVIYTNDDRVMAAVLSDCVQQDLLEWAEQQRENRISDVRNYDDKLIYAVTGTLSSYDDYKQLIETACRFYDALTAAVSNQPDTLA